VCSEHDKVGPKRGCPLEDAAGGRTLIQEDLGFQSNRRGGHQFAKLGLQGDFVFDGSSPAGRFREQEGRVDSQQGVHHVQGGNLRFEPPRDLDGVIQRVV
jgi:hypothetical protein